MSQLPKGTALARSYLESVALKGAMALLVGWAPFLGWPVIKNFVEAMLQRLLLDPLFDEATAIAIAVKYVIDRHAFDSHFLKLKMLEHAPAIEQEAALEDAEKAMATFIRRGPVQ